MESYESTCQQCGHRWSWTGYKTGIGKTQAQLDAMDKAGKTCPRCGGPAKVGLDYGDEASSPARFTAAVMSGLKPLPQEGVPLPPPEGFLPFPNAVKEPGDLQQEIDRLREIIREEAAAWDNFFWKLPPGDPRRTQVRQHADQLRQKLYQG